MLNRSDNESGGRKDRVSSFGEDDLVAVVVVEECESVVEPLAWPGAEGKGIVSRDLVARMAIGGGGAAIIVDG